jgi:arylsulfatase A-like enzyme
VLHADAIKAGHFANGPLLGQKTDAWEGGHRVPFLARWPGRIPAGAVSDEIICLVDLMATCAAMLGTTLPPEAGVDSYDVLPALLGQKLRAPIREATVFHSASGKFAIRQGPWVLIDAATGDDNGKSGEPDWLKRERGYEKNTAAGELYDLRNDLPQRANAYARKPEIVARLKALLEKYKADGRSTPGPAQPNTPPGAGTMSSGIPDER